MAVCAAPCCWVKGCGIRCRMLGASAGCCWVRMAQAAAADRGVQLPPRVNLLPLMLSYSFCACTKSVVARVSVAWESFVGVWKLCVRDCRQCDRRSSRVDCAATWMRRDSVSLQVDAWEPARPAQLPAAVLDAAGKRRVQATAACQWGGGPTGRRAN